MFNIAHNSCLRYCKSTIFQANHNHKASSDISLRLFAILQKYDFSSKSQLPCGSTRLVMSCLRYCKSTIFQANHNRTSSGTIDVGLFAILQKYDFSSKSQPLFSPPLFTDCCLRYCKSTIFQANHNALSNITALSIVVCDTAKVRFFKQITTENSQTSCAISLFAILQKYDFSSKSQRYQCLCCPCLVVCDTAKVRFFKQITTFPSRRSQAYCCLRYCKSTIFQANHNFERNVNPIPIVVCDTAKVRFFKQITTACKTRQNLVGCLRYCKSTIFQANHNCVQNSSKLIWLFAILQKYDFSSKSQPNFVNSHSNAVVCDTAKVRFFKQITTQRPRRPRRGKLFAILQKYDFSSKSQLVLYVFD